MTALLALIRKDLQLFLTDRRALLFTIALPIVFASFFGFLFGGKKGDVQAAGIPVLWVDEDRSDTSAAIRTRLAKDSALQVEDALPDAAKAQVRNGKVRVAIVVPKGFEGAARDAIAHRGPKPTLTLWRDPSRNTELQLVRGRVTGQVVQTLEQGFFAKDEGLARANEALVRLEQRPEVPDDEKAAVRAMRENVARYGAARGPDSEGSALPFVFADEAIAADETPYNGYSHAFAGNGVQFILFGAIECGVGILTERQRGLWRRLRAAPISRSVLLLARLISGALISFFCLMVLYAFGRVVFDVRIGGSVPGFLAIATAYSLAASTFGLMIATLGKTPAGARGPATFTVLLMGMLGGSMVPAFLFPRWMQQASLAMPTRWAIDGLEAVTWRGQGVQAALMPSLVLCGFAAIFAAVTIARFRWDAD